MYLTYIHPRIVQSHLPHEQHLDCLRVCSDSRRIGGEDGSDEELRNRHPWATSGEGGCRRHILHVHATGATLQIVKLHVCIIRIISNQIV